MRRPHLQYETLESRNLMAVDFGDLTFINPIPIEPGAYVANDGVLRVNGSNGADDINIEPITRWSYSWNGSRWTFSTEEWVSVTIRNANTNGVVFQASWDADQVASIRVEAFDGNDIVHNRTSISSTMIGAGGRDQLYGGSNRDWLYGNGDDDTLVGNDGNDYLDGGADNDTLRGDRLNNSLSGFADTMYGRDGVDTMHGGGGDDYMDGGNHDDVMFGNDGRDQMYGRDGNDDLDGGLGNDTLRGGRHSDDLYGGLGADILYGESGTDNLYGDSNAPGTIPDVGTHGDDWLNGGTGIDTLHGEGGNDWLDGNEHRDTLHGGDGIDWLLGGDGNDTLNGDGNTDYLYGFDGDDTLNGGAGDDRLYGGEDDDELNGGGGIDYLYGHNGRDVLRGGDQTDYLYGGGGNDLLEGDAGVDYLRGGYGDDLLRGGASGDYLYGEGDNDTLYGNAGNDYLSGGDGNDGLYGGRDFDWLHGGAGGDRFLTDGDVVLDRSSQDAHIQFVNAAEGWLFSLSGWRYTAAGNWTANEIEIVDQALGALMARTGNTDLLKTPEGDDLTFLRRGTTLWSTSGTEFNGVNHLNGSITLGNNTFSDEAWAVQTTLHEVAHNWHGADFFNDFRDAHNTTAAEDFHTDYARTNAEEDLGETWAFAIMDWANENMDELLWESRSFQDDFTNDMNHDQVRRDISDKLEVLDAFFASIAD